ncbi:MAG: LuxR C-terminal-related transcriptional regulator [Pseudomonadota bacterium]
MKLLTEKQVEVLQMRAGGSPVKEIAFVLQKSESAINEHIKAAQKRLEARNPVHTLALAIAFGEVDVESDDKDLILEMADLEEEVHHLGLADLSDMFIDALPEQLSREMRMAYIHSMRNLIRLREQGPNS